MNTINIQKNSKAHDIHIDLYIDCC